MSKPCTLNPPERIYLQVGDIDDTCEFNECYMSGEVTWCHDKQFDTDIEYRLVKRSRKKNVAPSVTKRPPLSDALNAANPTADGAICDECNGSREVLVDGVEHSCPVCCCEDCGVPPGESHYSSCCNYVTPGFAVNRKTAL
jgi:hypothetical protein